jgi:putative ABC transport system permease protein
VLKLAFKNLFAHPLRSALTIGALSIATFLVCFLASIVTALDVGLEGSGVRRLWTQTAVSLFATMPQSYEQKIESVEGVDDVVKFQWFGGVYKDPKNFFGQFAVEPEGFAAAYPEMTMVDGSMEGFFGNRRGAIIGDKLQERFPEFEVGTIIPLLGTIFPNEGGKAWEFEVVGVYTAEEPYIDRSAMFFHWDYFEDTLDALDGVPPEVGTFVFVPEEGADLDVVSARVDDLFAGGPMRTLTTTESEFNRQFIGMIGSLPRFLSFLGAGVFVAILLACINTMLMAAREQTHDVGVLKALGFSDGRIFTLMLAQGLALCCIGGGLGLLLAKGSEPAFQDALARYFPAYRVTDQTLLGAAVISVAIGFVAGIIPAIGARRLSPVAALRANV